MTCRKGDLAIVIHAKHESNLGAVVRVLDVDDGGGDIVFKNEPLVWHVSSPFLMTWSKDGRLFQRKIGPVPDWKLQPIRGCDNSEHASGKCSHCQNAQWEKQREQIVANMGQTEVREMDKYGLTVSEFVELVEMGMLRHPKAGK
ncbi:MAG: hypothetical protein ING75_03670 [Rhodocyclaceae bacterium]|nr:hypothetical protein [Rhodocyclaceae bacterium]